MIQISDTKTVGSKWSRRTQTASQDFSDGVKAPKKDWQKNTAAAEDSYKTGVTAAANQGRFGKGVVKAGTAKWQKNTIEVGVGRWPTGVAMGQPAYEAGFAPFADAISKITLSPRYAKGDPRNYVRSQEIGKTLNALKTGQVVA